MAWLMYTSTWYVMLLIIGIIFFPLTRLIFPSFADRGYAFSKALGIVLITYVMYVLGTIHILPFTLTSLLIIGFSFIILNYYLSRNYHRQKHSTPSLLLMLFEESLTALVFFGWAYIRSREPSIHGLEKFMDYGFMQSALKGEYFPSKDMWLAGKSINYYYFGHLTGAVLTKLSSIPPYISYNLILAHLCALGVVQTFSLTFSIVRSFAKKNTILVFVTALLGSFLVNFGGNLHTLYTLTIGYGNNPTPLWKLAPKYSFIDLLHPFKLVSRLPEYYWYPDATRYIPFTIHEFPLYSYVVADLHGHVYGIPFVLLTLGLLYSLFTQKNTIMNIPLWKNFKESLSFSHGHLGYVILLSFMISIHLMTNAFDAPIYLLLSGIILLALYGFTTNLFLYLGILVGGFVIFTLPFSVGFEPFATGVGFNCIEPGLSNLIKTLISGTFLEKRFVFENNCQSSQWWMLLMLWGFFWFNFIFLITYVVRKKFKVDQSVLFLLILFAYSTLLIIVPEFIYAKDIYPTHFRANTMFKLGYQAFIMMGIGSACTFALYKKISPLIRAKIYIVLFCILLTFVALYPMMAINSYYSPKSTIHSLDGSEWILTTYPEYSEIITYLNQSVDGQPTILEAQGDSYTDFNVVSAYTGLPTVAGWWVHQWLWRGNSQVVGKLIPDIEALYSSTDTDLTRKLLRKYDIRYVIIGSNERKKYTDLYEIKFEALGKAVFRSKTGSGIIYEIPIDRY